MSYCNFIGEFVAPFDSDDWAKHIKWNERRPVQTRGALNPWEVERVRIVWEQEKAAWVKIQVLKKEYVERERQMKTDVDIFNAHLSELERITKKKVGLGPIGTYGGMALAVIPGFGWFSAAFSALSMGIEMIGGNKKKKRINELMRIMEDAQQRLQRNQERLLAIQQELRMLMNVTERAKAGIEEKKQADLRQWEAVKQLRSEQETVRHLLEDQEKAKIRQTTPNRVVYRNDL